MNNVHLVVPDLFLPEGVAGRVCDGLHLQVLEKLLARGVSTDLARTGDWGVSLERHLCESFGSACQGDVPVAAVSATFDRLGEGCWLRADPVHLHLDQSRMLLSAVSPTGEEATALCASLNEHFVGQGVTFFAPHPQRWYVRMDALPRIRTTPLAQVIGRDVRGALPVGDDAMRWHGIFNEIQMLLYSHPVNDAREGRGEIPVNSIWLWGGGCSTDIALQKNFDSVSSDSVLPEMFANAATVPFLPWGESLTLMSGRQLLVWTGLRTALQRGDLAAWRAALQDFEVGYAGPLWRALRSGSIDSIRIEVLSDDSVRRTDLSLTDTWAFWRRVRALDHYSLV